LGVCNIRAPRRKRAFDDSSLLGGEGIDELPNSVEDALREEKAVFEAGTEGRVEAIRATAQAAEKFLKQNEMNIEEKLNEIASLQDQITAGGGTDGKKRKLREDLESANADLELLKTHRDTTANLVKTRNETLDELENKQLS
jgi:hypothetical protein